ncbi:hypothetical protein OFY17_14790 [Marinomonas sp. C2222]|uniref:DUF2474 domain-containing protein n=1 Tax=Marinomonas sargassi TaxID=2984494 RepID=A0ABT2YW53_9GAMM|nr:hypothetical protein [Marinomonas sargassi]MCV2404130.1 hypothetical protein [Marinomonas sargassi]
MFRSIKAKTAHFKSWQWFLLLYLVGFISLVATSYLLKLFIKTLP